MKGPLIQYQENVKSWSSLAEKEKSRYQKTIPLRILLFLSGFALIILAFSSGFPIGLLATFSIIPALALFTAWHQKLLRKSERFIRLKELNEREIDYLNGNYKPGDTGAEFKDPDHPYHTDLDIFGDNSVFGAINRTSTIKGKSRLASWLSSPGTEKEIRMRQEAAKELSGYTDWRQLFQLEGLQSKEKQEDINDLLVWLNGENHLQNTKWLRPVLIILPVITLILTVLSFFIIPGIVPVMAIVIQAFIIRKYRKIVHHTHETTSAKAAIFKKYQALFQLTESKELGSEYLKSLKKTFTNEEKASGYIKSLGGYSDNLDLRHNVLGHFFINYILLWDLNLVWKLENWKKKVKSRAPEWFDSIGEMDALNSLGTLTFNHPDWTFPEILTDQFHLSAKELGHLLIPAHKRITNDFEIEGRGMIHLITGSNMAGKSTFLRTVGINIVLAMAGAPVCAKRMTMPVIRLYSSMRNTDSLEQNESSFYAELKRLKMILDHVENDPNSFFLVDEILKGTNSADRHRGSLAMIYQLLKYKGTGLISTHDLELAEQVESVQNVRNYSFEVQIDGEELNFDYTLREGICRSFNASVLMQKMGIDMGSVSV